MAIKPIIQVGAPVIRKAKAIPRNFDKARLKRIIRDLIDSMHAADLIGIAGSQIGVGLQIFVTEIRRTKHRKNLQSDDELRVYINPKIISKSKTQTVLMEGCGSVAKGQLHGPVRRPEKVEIEALDENGKKFRLKAEGLLAKCLQHEYDHLQGTIVLDKFLDTKKVIDLSSLKNRKK